MKALLFLLLTALPLLAENTWPPKKFAHVVAYCYDYIRDPRGNTIIFPDGTHHTGIIAPFTTRLSNTQTQTLLTLLNTNKEGGEADCYDPHHAFVFYDKDWKPVASIDICFVCSEYRARPNLLVESIDLQTLEKFVIGLGLPFFEDLKEYQALFNKHHATNPKRPASPPSKDSIDPFAAPDE